MDLKAQLDEYNNKLSELQKQCSQAEKDVIVAETNLNNLTKQKATLVQECETFAGTTFSEIPELLQQKNQELTAIMSRIAGIDVNGPITQEKLDELDAIMKEFGIQPVY